MGEDLRIKEESVIKMLPGVLDDPGEVVLFGGGDDLAPLRLAHLAPAALMPFHIFTAMDGVPGEFALTWRRGRPLPREAQEMVWGYFAMAEAGEVLAYLEARLEDGQGAGEAGEPLQLLADTLLVLTQHVFCHDQARTPENLARAHTLMAALAKGLRASDDILRAVSSLRRHDSGLFSHCLNVALLALALAPAMSQEPEAGETMALGALLHDLGMMPWARETFHQTTPLTDDDWDNIKAHPHRGADQLAPLAVLPEEGLLMIRQHHESVNGSGYPLGLQVDGIHPWARIIKILDSYEAMTSLRPWRPPISERQAMRIMASAWSAQGSYDPDYLKRFLAFCQKEEGHRA
jgi:HD-GYP domain-containing protein (c-di-GMP phosphodiesterase class II)